MKLTVGSTTGLKLPEGHTKNGKPITDFVYWDSEVPGFGLRLRAGGKRAFIFQYKTGGTQYRMTLGKYPAIAAPQAALVRFGRLCRYGYPPSPGISGK